MESHVDITNMKGKVLVKTWTLYATLGIILIQLVLYSLFFVNDRNDILNRLANVERDVKLYKMTDKKLDIIYFNVKNLFDRQGWTFTEIEKH